MSVRVPLCARVEDAACGWWPSRRSGPNDEAVSAPPGSRAGDGRGRRAAPVLLAVGLGLLQLLAVGYASVLAGGAAEAGALALAAGARPARRRHGGAARLVGGDARGSRGGRPRRGAPAPAVAAAARWRAARGRGHGGGGGAVTRQRAALGGRGPLATALAAAGAWLLEPAEPAASRWCRRPRRRGRSWRSSGWPRSCGVTWSRGRSPPSSPAATPPGRRPSTARPGRPASRLRRRLPASWRGSSPRCPGRTRGRSGASAWSAVRSAARVADTARHFAPLVLDAGGPRSAACRRRWRTRSWWSASPSTEPALAAVAVDCLARLGTSRSWCSTGRGERDLTRRGRRGRDQPTVVRSRHHVLPDSRMGAQLALGGREPRGRAGPGDRRARRPLRGPAMTFLGASERLWAPNLRSSRFGCPHPGVAIGPAGAT